MSETTVIRGLGDKPGDDISDPLLTHEVARIARGEYALDSNAPANEISGQGYYIGYIEPGTIVDIVDRQGRVRKAVVDRCQVRFSRSGEKTFTADTNLTLEAEPCD